MNFFSVISFLLIGVCSYAISTSKVITNEHPLASPPIKTAATTSTTTAKKLNLVNRFLNAETNKFTGTGRNIMHALKAELYSNKNNNKNNNNNNYNSYKNVEPRHKRSQYDFGEYKDLNDIIEDIEDNTITQAAAVPATTTTTTGTTATGLTTEFDLENVPSVAYYMLLQKLKQLQNNEPIYRVRTPRLGRSIDFQLLQPNAANAANNDALLLDDIFGNSDRGSSSGSNSYSGSGSDSYNIGNIGGIGVENIGKSRQKFLSRIIKKSVPFKPRLGKRTQVCD